MSLEGETKSESEIEEIVQNEIGLKRKKKKIKRVINIILEFSAMIIGIILIFSPPFENNDLLLTLFIILGFALFLGGFIFLAIRTGEEREEKI